MGVWFSILCGRGFPTGVNSLWRAPTRARHRRVSPSPREGCLIAFFLKPREFDLTLPLIVTDAFSFFNMALVPHFLIYNCLLLWLWPFLAYIFILLLPHLNASNSWFGLRPYVVDQVSLDFEVQWECCITGIVLTGFY